ncbi:hypothetical protein SRHO_G00154640 [Serrasalmus rhombeus]
MLNPKKRRRRTRSAQLFTASSKSLKTSCCLFSRFGYCPYLLPSFGFSKTGGVEEAAPRSFQTAVGEPGAAPLKFLPQKCTTSWF